MTRSVTDVKTLGAAIRAQRLARGWTQAELADQANVSRRFVGELEAGTRTGAELARVFALLRTLRLGIDLVSRGSESFEDALDEVLG